MKKKLSKVIIHPEKEYDTLRQEVIKRLEFQNTLLTINTTFVAAFLGFGLQRGNNTLVLVIPPFELLFALMAKHNTYYMTKIDFFIEQKFETKGSMLWETFDVLFTKNILAYQLILGMGSYGVYFLYPLIALGLGIHNADVDGTSFQLICILIDVFSFFLICWTFYYFNWQRIRKWLHAQVEERIEIHNESQINGSDNLLS